MWKWGLRLVFLSLVSAIGYGAYDYYRADLHTRPDMPDGAFSISFKSGLRAILVGIPNEKDKRRYFGYPADLPFYIEEAWSTCTPPEGDETAEAEKFLEVSNKPGETFEVVCRIDVDGEIVIRGFITSVPRL